MLHYKKLRSTSPHKFVSAVRRVPITELFLSSVQHAREMVYFLKLLTFSFALVPSQDISTHCLLLFA